MDERYYVKPVPISTIWLCHFLSLHNFKRRLVWTPFRCMWGIAAFLVTGETGYWREAPPRCRRFGCERSE